MDEQKLKITHQFLHDEWNNFDPSYGVCSSCVSSIGSTVLLSLWPFRSPCSRLSFSLVCKLAVLCVDSQSRKYCCATPGTLKFDFWCKDQCGLLCNLGLDISGLPPSHWGQCASSGCGGCVEFWNGTLKSIQTRNVLAVRFWCLKFTLCSEPTSTLFFKQVKIPQNSW